MNKSRTLACLLLAVAATLLISGCNLDKMSKEDRIDAFIDDVVSGSYGSLYSHLADSVSQKDAARAGSSYWDLTPFGSNKTVHSFGSPSVGGSSATVSHTNSIDIQTVTFQLEEESKDSWFISRITRPIGFDLQ